MPNLYSIIELFKEIEACYKKDESKVSEEIQKKKIEARNKKRKELSEKLREIQKELNEDFSLLIQSLKDLLGISEADFSDFIAQIVFDLDKSIQEKLNIFESKKQQFLKYSDGELPADLLQEFPAASNNKLGFNSKFYFKILSFAELLKNFEKIGNPKVHAFNLCIFFNRIEELFDYLQSYGSAHKQSTNVFHDACNFNLPPDDPLWNIEIWKKLAKKYLAVNDKFRILLPFSGKIEQRFSGLSEQSSVSELEAIYVQLKYTRSNENKEAAKLFHESGIIETNFNKYLDEILPNAKDSSRIPDVTVSLPNSLYYLKKLNPFSPLAAVLGRKTNCCQLIGGAGEACAIHGITSEEGGFYVVYEAASQGPKPNDEIVAQCWAWRSKNQALVFDSIEFSVNLKDKIKKECVVQLYVELARILVSNVNDGIPFVAVGAYGETPAHFGINGVGQFYVFEMPIDYNGYRDSLSQRLVSTKDFPLFLESSLDVHFMFKHAKLKHWMQSCIHSHKETLLQDFKKRVSEARDKECHEVESIIEKSCYLHDECQKKINEIDWERLGQLSKEGYCIDLPDQFGTSLLIRLIHEKDPLRFKWLFAQDPESSQLIFKSKAEASGVIWVLYSITPEIFEFLLENKLLDIQDLIQKKVELYFKLIEAAEAKQWNLVRILIENGVCLDHATYYGKRSSVLSVAVDQENINEIRWLLEKGAKVKDEDLHNVVSEKDRWDIFEILVSNSLDKINLALLLAARGKKWELVRKYVNQGGISIEDLWGPSPSVLNITAQEHQWELVKQIITKSAFTGTFALRDALYFALKARSWDMVCWLISKGADCNIAMLYHAETKEWDRVKELISNFGGGINYSHNEQSYSDDLNTWSGSTVLMKASNQENLEMMDWLLKQGAKLSLKNAWEISCFCSAFQNKKAKSIDFFIKNCIEEIQDDLYIICVGKIINSPNNTQSKAEAEMLDWRTLIKFIKNINGCDPCTKHTLLTAACSVQNPDWQFIEDLIINQKANINARNENQETALFQLCRNSIVLARVQWFQKLGADIYLLDGKGKSCVLASLEFSPNFEVACWLIEHKVDNINTVFPSSAYGGDTILLKTCFNGHLEHAKVLVSRGADIKHKTSTGDNAVIMAVSGGRVNLEMLEWLILEQKLKVNEKNNQGETALLKAAAQYKWSAVKKLLALGADINVFAKREMNNSLWLFKTKAKFDRSLHEQKQYSIDTVLRYAIQGANNQDAWKMVSYILQETAIDLSKNGIHKNALQAIEQHAPDFIKEIVAKKGKTRSNSETLLFSMSDFNGGLQDIEQKANKNTHRRLSSS